MHHSTTSLLITVLVSALAGYSTSRMAPPSASPLTRQDADEAASSVTLLRGMDLPVRSRGEAEVTDATSTISYEAYYDWDYGAITLVSETGDLATLDSPMNWGLRTATDSNGDMVSLCFRPGTGEAYVVNDDEEWEAISEPDEQAVPVLGEYDVQISLTEDGGLTGLRQDALSGRSWLLTVDGWKPLPGNVPGWPE